MMKLIRQSFTVLCPKPLVGVDIMLAIEESARLCYKSEDKIKPGSADKLIASLIERGHHAMIELGGVIKVRFITDRGVTHELVRHRLCSFAQESTRYCNYSKDKHGGECAFIIPSWFDDVGEGQFTYAQGQIFDDPCKMHWFSAMQETENKYLAMLEAGATPQEARSVLPNSLKTEIDVMANIREWRHILTLRTAKNAHPQMQDLMLPLLALFKKEMPILFNDILERG